VVRTKLWGKMFVSGYQPSKGSDRSRRPSVFGCRKKILLRIVHVVADVAIRQAMAAKRSLSSPLCRSGVKVPL